MKSSVAITVSVIGVLASAGAAFAANTHVLDQKTAAPSVTPPAPAVSAVASSPANTVVYDLGPLGKVTVRRSGDLVEVVDVASAWAVTTVPSASGVVLEFAKDGTAYRFSAIPDAGGAVAASLAGITADTDGIASTVPATPGLRPLSPGTTSDHDDHADGHDEEWDDEHDDEFEEDEVEEDELEQGDDREEDDHDEEWEDD